jgi:hypothetical protein
LKWKEAAACGRGKEINLLLRRSIELFLFGKSIRAQIDRREIELPRRISL